MDTETRDHRHASAAHFSAGQRDPAGDGAPRDRTRWALLAATGVAAVLVALGWGALSLAGLIDDVDSWARSGVPGVVEVDVEEPGELVVRSDSPGSLRWGSPERDIEVIVHGPDGGGGASRGRDVGWRVPRAGPHRAGCGDLRCATRGRLPSRGRGVGVRGQGIRGR